MLIPFFNFLTRRNEARRTCNIPSQLAQPWLILFVVATSVLTTPCSVPAQPSEVAGPREVLKLFDLDESQINFLRDGGPIVDGEWEPLHRLLYVLPRVDVITIDQWTESAPSWSVIRSDPDRHRLRMFRIGGQLREVTTLKITPESAQRFGFSEFFRLRVACSPDESATIYARKIPSAWRPIIDRPITDEFEIPVSCNGLLLKLGESEAGHVTLIFVTNRTAWHPQRPAVQLGIGRGEAELGRLGMDVGLLDNLSQRSPLEGVDRECFYQLLWSAGRQPEAADRSHAPREQQTLDIVTALKSPQLLRGERFHLQGLARRALKVRVAEADIRDRYGVEHYFEIELFAPLKKSLRLVDARNGKERLHHNFPMTICCRSLPDGMPTGDQIRQMIEVNAFFMKLRSYRSGASTVQAADYQLSPLLIAKTVTLVAPSVTRNPLPAWLLAGVVFGGVAFALAVRQWYRRADQRFQQWRRTTDDAPRFDL